ncbi:MAG: protease modulator HflC [Pseudomonadota bacterium]
MKRNWLLILGIAVIVVGVIASAALFTVYQTKQVIVMQFGDPKRVIAEPGLYAKLPFIQDVLEYEKRVLNLDPPVESMLLSDQKRLLVDAFARYRIQDPLQFFRTVRTEATARQRLGGIINASLREALGNTTLASLLSEERGEILDKIAQNVNRQAQRFGIEIVDVRIRRADLPDETSQAVYARMKSEREREAAEFRAQGFEQAQRIKASADREATVIRAEAKREAEILRGQGEGARTSILNDAFGQDADFFNFYRSMQAYDASLADDSTFMVLSPDSEFFSFFDQIEPNTGDRSETSE